MTGENPQPPAPFRLVEATIAQLHAAIQSGQTTCAAVVQEYLTRARAYNGVASILVTQDGRPVPPAPGAIRAQAPIQFPTETVKASEILPDLDQYQGPPLEFGRMEPTASDPQVHQQFGMITGIPPGRLPGPPQLNALATFNIRGERSVTCRGDFDRHPALGPLPPAAPPVCEHFRHYPDALERAAQLDAAYGPNPDLQTMPMYGVVFSFKDPFDTKDMRSTGGADAAYDIDFPARDHILVQHLRDKGAIIFAKAVNTEYNGRAGDPGGRHAPGKILPSVLGYQRSTWSGNPANVYDPTRAASLGSSSGSAVSVSANLVMASLGEETRASTRGPSNHNAIALILPHKAMIPFSGGAIGADIYCDRTGILARRLTDCAQILDALKDPETGYYDPRDPFTTVPRASIHAAPYAPHAQASGQPNSLRGVRIGVIRESMAYHPNSKAEEPIVTAAAREINQILAGKLGATLVESSDPLWPPDPNAEPMQTDFRRALAILTPVFMPDLLFRLDDHGQPLFPEFADAITPTEFAPGKTFGSGKIAPIDYMVELAEGRIQPAANLDLPTVQQQELAMSFRYHIRQYLTRRAADWQNLGFTESLTDWPALNARSKFWGDDQRAAFRNWQEITDPRNPLTGRQGVPERIMLRELLRRVETHNAPRTPPPRRYDGTLRKPPRRPSPPPHPLPPRQNRPRPPPRHIPKHPPRILQRPQRRPNRNPNPRRLHPNRLRPHLPPPPTAPHTPPQPNTPRHLPTPSDTARYIPTPSDTPTPLPQPGAAHYITPSHATPHTPAPSQLHPTPPPLCPNPACPSP